MLDLFCGRGGWTNAFLDRGWTVTGIDTTRHVEYRGDFLRKDVREVRWQWVMENFDFVCASSVCDGFASFGMKHWRPNPPHPLLEIELFLFTRDVCESSGVLYVMENVRTAQQFVGHAVNHCGPFYLWGNSVPPILPQGISKAKWYRRPGKPGNFADELNLPKSQRKAKLATIPLELANCVADYAARILQTNSVIA